MKRLGRVGKGFLAVLLCAVMLALAGCATLGSENSDEAERASANRQYMAQLNRQMGDLQQVMDDFQVAVSEKNTVAMRAQAQKADAIIQQIDASEATDDLEEAKGLYVDALTTLNGAMTDYADLYTEADSGSVSPDDLEQRIADVQAAYDEGVEKLQKADEAVAALAQG